MDLRFPDFGCLCSPNTAACNMYNLWFVSENYAKNCWRSAIDHFRKDYSAKEKSGCSSPARRKYSHFDELLFLAPTRELRPYVSLHLCIFDMCYWQSIVNTHVVTNVFQFGLQTLLPSNPHCPLMDPGVELHCTILQPYMEFHYIGSVAPTCMFSVTHYKMADTTFWCVVYKLCYIGKPS